VIAGWTETAALKRAAEDHLIARYRSELFKGDAPEDGRGYLIIRTPAGPARQFFPAMYALRVERRSVWPETQIAIDAFLDFADPRRAVVLWPLWPPARWHDAEPAHNDVLWVNIGEAIHKRFNSRSTVQPGATVYFIWGARADLQDPPASGEPPAELLSARRKLDAIRSI
jgi:hypothetical protein